MSKEQEKQIAELDKQVDDLKKMVSRLSLRVLALEKQNRSLKSRVDGVNGDVHSLARTVQLQRRG